jgi:hypothetical protein
VLLDGASTRPLSAQQFARRVTLLAQSRPTPSGVSVRDVVGYGRHPYRGRRLRLVFGIGNQAATAVGPLGGIPVAGTSRYATAAVAVAEEFLHGASVAGIATGEAAVRSIWP